MSSRIIQQTLEGLAVSAMPRVRTTDGHLLDWDREAIAKQLLKETKLSEQFYKEPGITEEEAQDIAKEVERRVRWMNVRYLSGPLVREIMNVILLERHHTEWRNICTRVGTPVYDAHLIDIGTGFEAKENANLQENAETSHKKKADKISKEQYLLLLPPYLADRHLAGDLHIHDLEYFGTRPFCQDWDLRYFFYYGLMPDGLGTKASVAGPAKKAEVAILHAVKALGSAQTNFAGGQGFYNFLTFIAPYFEGLPYEEIKQLMQMFVYEMTQMMVARGGQLVFSSVQLTPGVPQLWKNKPAVYSGKVWNGSSPDAPLKNYGEVEREVRLAFKALMEVMLDGDYWGKPFNFPKPEISIEPDFMQEDMAFNASHPDLPTYQDLYLLTFKLQPSTVRPTSITSFLLIVGQAKEFHAISVALTNSRPQLKAIASLKTNWTSRTCRTFSMGSWQVVSLNCPRAAYLARGDDDLLFEYLRELMDTSVEMFKVKRQWMNQIINNHRMPFATEQPARSGSRVKRAPLR